MMNFLYCSFQNRYFLSRKITIELKAFSDIERKFDKIPQLSKDKTI
jgi:hypothetical protein